MYTAAGVLKGELKHMKLKNVISCTLTMALATVCFAGVTGCSTKPANPNDKGLTGGVAATVNGVEIPEDDVTRWVNSVRNSQNLMDDKSGWAKYLADQKATPTSMRYDFLASKIKQELVEQYANERDSYATDEQIDAAVKKIRDNYSSDEAWQKGLEGAGFEDEQDYRDALQYSISYENLNKGFKVEVAKDKPEYLEELAKYDGARKSSHILFGLEDKETAQQVLDQINEGTLELSDAAKQYSNDSGSAEAGGDVGWDKLTTFVEPYQNALNNLEIGQVSGLVESEYGYHIIKCTDIFKAPSTADNLADVPQEIETKVEETVSLSDSTKKLDEWIEEKRDVADVVINPMPEKAPYKVNMTGFLTEDEQKEIDNKAAKAAGLEIEGTEEEIAEGESAENSESSSASSDAAESASAEAPTAEATDPESTEG